MRGLLLVLSLVSAFAASAYDEEITVDKIKYGLTASTKEASVLGPVDQSATIVNLVIPDQVSDEGVDYKVTSIGNDAFRYCSSFTGTLILPEGLTSIGQNAFYGCSGFTGRLTLPESLTSIRYGAFAGCSHLTGVLILPKSLTNLEGRAFEECSGLTGSLTIPVGVTKIGYQTFYGCSGFIGLTLPEGLTSIENGAFYNCYGLSGNLILPESLITIGESAFRRCGRFTGDLIIPQWAMSIGDYAFESCSGFKGKLVLPKGLKSIGYNAFDGCKGFTGDLVIPEGVENINSYTFYGCSGFNGTLTLPDGLRWIGKSAFQGCSGFTGALTLPGRTYYIDEYAFSGCKGFTSLTLSENTTKIGVKAFAGCSGFVGTLNLPIGLEEIENSAFRDCSGFTGLILPKGLKNVGEFAFYHCSGIKENIIIPYRVTEIGANAFTDVGTGILKLPQSLKNIGDAFSGDFHYVVSQNPVPPANIGCETEPAIPGGIFSDNILSGKLIVPTGSIEEYKSAYGWQKFKYIIEGEPSIFHNLLYIIVSGEEGEDDYVRVIGINPDADGTLEFPMEIEIDGKKYPVTQIAEGACEGRGDIRKVIFPESIVYVGDEAFADCPNLKEVVTEDCDKTLTFGNDVFAGCPIETIYNGRNNSGNPFAGNDNLRDVTIGEKVDALAPGEFAGCPGITDITVLNPVPPTVGESAFDDDVYNGAVPRVPDGSVDDYKAAEGWKDFFNILAIDKIDAMTILLNTTSISIEAESAVQLTAIITPEVTTDKSVIWSSSDEGVATVNANGLVTAVAAGSATITATTTNGLTATCTVTVTAKQSGIEGVEGDSAGVRVEGNAIVAPEGSKVYDLSGREVTPTSLNPGIYIVRIPGGKAVKVRV